MRLISGGAIVDDTWRHLAEGSAPAAGEAVIATWADWNARRGALEAHRGPLGVRVPPDVDLEALGADAARFALIAVEFPTYRDGRGYSVARLLRERYGFRGELRAVGYVLRDQLFYMARVGFTAFELAPGKPLESALEAFTEFSDVYQAAADDRVPVWRRRRAP